MENWESLFCEYIAAFSKEQNDASHDLGHFQRVYQTAKCIAEQESASVDLLVILAAAYFHDIVSLPKDHPDNKMSSRFAAVKAKEILIEMEFPHEKIEAVCHAIATHSFSARLEPETIEAKIIQDADRMEALGALGALRTFYVSGRLGRKPFDPEDLHAKGRPLDDKLFGLDHFYLKLFKLPDLLKTNGGRLFAQKRLDFLKYFVEELEENVQKNSGGALVVVTYSYQAGSKGLQLFHASDPFAINRPLDTSFFVIDGVIGAAEQFPQFIYTFLSQFEREIC